jgi:hypothetical protein
VGIGWDVARDRNLVGFQLLRGFVIGLVSAASGQLCMAYERDCFGPMLTREQEWYLDRNPATGLFSVNRFADSGPK